MSTVVPWTEIESFHNIRKFIKVYPENLGENKVVTYRSKVKLHGTNAGIQCHKDGQVLPQSRTTLLTATADNAGFAKWVIENQSHWQLNNDLIIFGEWCGPGIQKGVAISSITKKVFAVFAAKSLTDNDLLIVEPDALQLLVKGIPDTYVLPWHKDSIDIDWLASDEELSVKTSLINNLVMDIEANDPWVEETFGVKGTGEGLVFYPRSIGHLGNINFNNLCFKAKGEKHKNIKTAAPAQVNPEVASSINQFVDMVLTEARLMQGAKAVAEDGSFSNKLIGKFISWITSDVQKETQDELSASNLDWKSVQKPISDKARTWYLTKI